MSFKNNPDSNSPFAFTIRKSRILFVLVISVMIVSLVWPGHALFSTPEPFILGFPLSFAWNILWVVIAFVAMLGLYLSDSKHEQNH